MESKEAIKPDLQERWRRLRGFVRRQIGDGPDADDLTQETLLRFVQTFGSPEGGAAGSQPANEMAWLMRTARNAIIDRHRHNARRPAVARLSDDQLARTVADESIVLDEATAVELLACLDGFVDRLPDPYRDVIRRVDLGREDRARVAADLGLTPTALKSRVVRGRAVLQGMLLACCHFEFNEHDRLASIAPRRAHAASNGSPAACGHPNQAEILIRPTQPCNQKSCEP